jgi:hypothetical protein
MPRIGFEPIVPMFRRQNTVCALHYAGTVIDAYKFVYFKIKKPNYIGCYIDLPKRRCKELPLSCFVFGELRVQIAAQEVAFLSEVFSLFLSSAVCPGKC